MPEDTFTDTDVATTIAFVQENFNFFSIPVANKLRTYQCLQEEFFQTEISGEAIRTSEQNYKDFCNLYSFCGCEALIKDFSEQFKKVLRDIKVIISTTKEPEEDTKSLAPMEAKKNTQGTSLHNIQIYKNALFMWEQGYFKGVIENHKLVRDFLFNNKNHPAILLFKHRANQATVDLLHSIYKLIIELDTVSKHPFTLTSIENLKTKLQDLRNRAITTDISLVAKEYSQLMDIEENKSLLLRTRLFKDSRLHPRLEDLSNTLDFYATLYPETHKKLESILRSLHAIKEDYINGKIDENAARERFDAITSRERLFLTRDIFLLKTNHANIQVKMKALAEYKKSNYEEVNMVNELIQSEQRILDNATATASVAVKQDVFICTRIPELFDIMKGKESIKSKINHIVSILANIKILTDILHDTEGSDHTQRCFDELGMINIESRMELAQISQVNNKLQRLQQESLAQVNLELQRLAQEIRNGCAALKSIDPQTLPEEDRERFELMRDDIIAHYDNCHVNNYSILPEASVVIKTMVETYNEIRALTIGTQEDRNRYRFHQCSSVAGLSNSNSHPSSMKQGKHG